MSLQWANRFLSLFRESLLLALTLGTLITATSVCAANIGEETFFPFTTSGDAGGESKSEWSALDERMASIEELAAKPGVDEAQLRRWLKEIDAINRSLSAYVTLLETRLNKLKSDLDTLGEALDNEPEAVAEQRKQMQAQKGEVEGKLAGYRLLMLHSETLSGNLTEQRQQLLTQHFLARGPHLAALLLEHGAMSWRWLVGLWQFITEKSGLQLLSTKQLLAMSGLILIGLWLGVVLRKRSRTWRESPHDGEYRYTGLLYGALGRYSPHMLAAVAMTLFALVTFTRAPYPFFFLLSLTLPLFFLLWALLYFLFFGKGEVRALPGMEPEHARGLGRSLRLFVSVSYTGYLILGGGLLLQMPEEGRLLARDLFVSVVVIALLWGARYLHLAWRKRGVSGSYGIVLLVLLGTLGAELLGYRNLSYWILRALAGTLFTFGAFWLFARLLNEFFAGLRTGQFWWQHAFRDLFGAGSSDTMPWLDWLRLLAAMVLWLGFAYVVLFIWGVSTESMQALFNYFFEGFLVGSLKVVPARIVVAVIVLAVLVAVSGWVRRRMEGRWLAQSRMERGSREALVTITGYIGVTIAIVLALGVAGVQFTNLAIIAGALSVGIGFGLQNIVNNFVSGLILLFERPVKTGDWILVGNTEGHVKRIRIRSTLIQTFDRADVIVPNSELISGQVTNWMLYDPRGRLKVPLGVAYGSDTQLVKDLLLRIAAEHPKVICDGSMPEPKVLFIGFGDSSLDFELRAFVQNIDERLQIVSDINFAIDAAFREHGIEIPFPQRDLHVRSWNNPPESS